MTKIFGPVPSRRLGRSLGINNIPPKICSYSCAYCQLGPTKQMQVERTAFFKPEDILFEVNEKVKRAKEVGANIDYLTFVADGEPTLDINIGKEIELLKNLGYKIAVITNASLLWRQDVREELSKADWVSIKVDSIGEKNWRKINCPHRSLTLNDVFDGIRIFAKSYQGELVTETMLVKSINDTIDCLKEIAEFLSELKPFKAYISIPIRPPALRWVMCPGEEVINQAYQIFAEGINNVEYLIGYEGSAFSFTGNIEEDLLSITSVHPMREDAVKKFLERAEGTWDVIQTLISGGKIKEVEYRGTKFYMRKFDKKL